jgi:hypothetical protein
MLAISAFRMHLLPTILQICVLPDFTAAKAPKCLANVHLEHSLLLELQALTTAIAASQGSIALQGPQNRSFVLKVTTALKVHSIQFHVL